MSARLGAGRKNDDGTFSGVLLGDWQEKIEDKTITTTGIYGYDNGAQSYAFKEDGTAFIGKSGTGRIVFNGEKGSISNEGRTGYDDKKFGTYFDLDNGYLDVRSENSTIVLSQGKNEYGSDIPFFEISTKKDNGEEEEEKDFHSLIYIDKDDYYL
jgi:hypothetical protein